MSKRAGKIILDPSHLAHLLFELLPSGRRYRALSKQNSQAQDSFFHQAIYLMNTYLTITCNTQHYLMHLTHTYLHYLNLYIKTRFIQIPYIGYLYISLF